MSTQTAKPPLILALKGKRPTNGSLAGKRLWKCVGDGQTRSIRQDPLAARPLICT